MTTPSTSTPPDRVAAIRFSGVDVVVEDDLTDQAVRRAVAAFLGVDPARVAVFDHRDDPPDDPSVDVLCVTAAVAGEFSRLISIHLAPVALQDRTELAWMQRLCELLGSRCMIPVEGPDPFWMWLCAPGVRPVQVGIDPDALDGDRYVVARLR